MLGLAARAGAVLPGTDRVRVAARGDGLHFVFVASDASDNALDKIVPLLKSREVPYAVVFDRDALGGAVGRAGISALGITDRKLASRVRELVTELEQA